MATDKKLGPDSRDRTARMRAMLDASLEMFAEEGFANVSTRRIAEAAGCSETLLFRYFGGKRGLILAIAEEFLVEAASEIPTAPPEYESLEDFISSYVISLCDNLHVRGQALRVVMAELITDPELAKEFEQTHAAAIQSVVDELERFVERGVIPSSHDLYMLATGIEAMAFTLGFVGEIIYGTDRKVTMAVADTMAGVLADGLRHRPGENGSTESLPPDALVALRKADTQLRRVLDQYAS